METVVIREHVNDLFCKQIAVLNEQDLAHNKYVSIGCAVKISLVKMP